MRILITVPSVVIATAAAKFERVLQNAVSLTTLERTADSEE